MGRDEDELMGSLPVPGEDPRFGNGEVIIVDNEADTQIEDTDHFPPIEVDEDPFLVSATDEDGVPGFRPYVEASATFEEAAGIEKAGDTHGDEVLGDDLVEHIRARDRAAVDDHGRPVSDLAMLAQTEHARHKAESAVAPYVNPTPESAYQGLLGGNAIIVSSGDKNAPTPPTQVVQWTGRDMEAGPVTVTLSPLPIATPVTTQKGNRAFARIQWGTRDTRHSVDIDCGRGQQLTIGASAVYVLLGINQIVQGGAKSIFSMQASISFRPCVRTDPLLFTSYIDAADNGAGHTTNITRPNFATSIMGIESDNTGGPYTLNFLDGQGNTVYSRQTAASATAPLQTPIMLSSDVVSVDVVNGAGSAANIRIMWGICV